MDAEGRILRASHGTRRLDAAETAAAYGPERSSDVLRRLCRDPIDDADRRLLRPFRVRGKQLPQKRHRFR